VFHDEVVASVLQQLLFKMLRRMKVLARRVTALTLALHTASSSLSPAWIPVVSASASTGHQEVRGRLCR